MFTGAGEGWLWLAAIGAVFGLIFGSAINAFVWRFHDGRSWVKGRSVCFHCGHELAGKDLIPVVSYLALRGKCRYCRHPIPDPPSVELVTAAVFALSFVALAPDTAAEWARLGFWLVMAVILIVLAVYDARWKLLPFKISWPLIGLALVYAVVMAVLTHSLQVLIGALLAGALAWGGFKFLVWITKGRGMGGGDVYLVAAMGLMLGLQGTAVAFFFAFNIGAVVGLVLIAMGRKGRKSHIPFGPYLIFGTFVAFLYGRQIADWYLSLSGLH